MTDRNDVVLRPRRTVGICPAESALAVGVTAGKTAEMTSAKFLEEFKMTLVETEIDLGRNSCAFRSLAVIAFEFPLSFNAAFFTLRIARNQTEQQDQNCKYLYISHFSKLF